MMRGWIPFLPRGTTASRDGLKNGLPPPLVGYGRDRYVITLIDARAHQSVKETISGDVL